MKDTYTTLAFMFVIVIFVCGLFSGLPNFKYNMPLFAKAYPFEGFDSINSPLGYTQVNNPTNAYDDTNLVRQIQPKMVDCKKVSGFNGLGVFCTPDTPAQKVDIYSDAPGSIDNRGYGYSNSKGGLSMDDNMITQLQTRGGNASGGNGQIGSGR